MSIDTPTLPPIPSCPSLAVSRSTILETRAPPRSPVAPSMRRRSPDCGKPPPYREFLLCQRPLARLRTHLCSHARSLRNTGLGPKGEAALAEVINPVEASSLQWVRARARVRGRAMGPPPPHSPWLQRPLTYGCRCRRRTWCSSSTSTAVCSSRSASPNPKP